MGVFDNVYLGPEPCPNCGALLSEWQTKEPKDEMPYLRHVRPWEVQSGETITAYCYRCHEAGERGIITYTRTETIERKPFTEAPND